MQQQHATVRTRKSTALLTFPKACDTGYMSDLRGFRGDALERCFLAALQESGVCLSCQVCLLTYVHETRENVCGRVNTSRCAVLPLACIAGPPNHEMALSMHIQLLNSETMRTWSAPPSKWARRPTRPLR